MKGKFKNLGLWGDHHIWVDFTASIRHASRRLERNVIVWDVLEKFLVAYILRNGTEELKEEYKDFYGKSL